MSSRKLQILELRLPFCPHTFSVSPCTASRSDGSECYQTFRTCKDRANFGAGTKSYLFCRPGTRPFSNATVWPVLTGVSPIAGTIDSRGGSGGRDRITFTLADFRHSGAGVDPYLRRRQPVSGKNPYFFDLLRRRNHIEGREVYYYTGEDDGSGRLNLTSMKRKAYYLDSIQPGRSGDVRVIATDLYGTWGDILIPPASEGELSADISDSQLYLDLKSGQGAAYEAWAGSVPFYVWLDKELVKVTARSTDNFTIVRAQGGTTESEHKTDSRVQISHSVELERIDDVWSDLHSRAGVPAALYDSLGATEVVDAWQGGWRLLFHWGKPMGLSKWLDELGQQTHSYTKWDAENQVAAYDCHRPANSGEILVTIRDGEGIIEDSVQPIPRPEERINQINLYYGPEDWSLDLNKQSEETPAYSRVAIIEDADAQSDNASGDTKPIDRYCWMLPSSMSAAVEAVGFRILNSRTEIPEDVDLSVPKFIADQVELGSFISLESERIIGEDGQADPVDCLITQKRLGGDPMDTTARLMLRPLRYAKSYARYAPSGTPTYPDDKAYGHYGDSSGLMPNGDPGQVYA